LLSTAVSFQAWQPPILAARHGRTGKRYEGGHQVSGDTPQRPERKSADRVAVTG